MTKTRVPAFWTSIAGSHYHDVDLIDTTSRARPIVVLVTSKVLMLQVGVNSQSLLMASLRLCVLG